MLSTIRLNDQPLLQAREIDDVIIDDQLPFELVGLEALSTEDVPQPIFGFGGRDAHCLRPIAQQFLASPLPTVATRRLSLSRRGERD